MTNPDLTDLIITQGRALVRAIEALGTIEPSGWFERALAPAAGLLDLCDPTSAVIRWPIGEAWG